MVYEREYFFSKAKSLKLNLPIPHTEMYEEAKSLREYFTKYRASEVGYQHSGWYSLSIHGLAYNKPSAWVAYPEFKSATDAIKELKWTEIADKCPITIKWLTEVFPSNVFGRVRFMLLEAGGFIDEHFDGEASAIEPINIALNNPDGCLWYWQDGSTLDFTPGDIYALNLSHCHSIRNNSSEDRYHMIVHHHDSTDAWKSLMIEAAERDNVEGSFHSSTEAY